MSNHDQLPTRYDPKEIEEKWYQFCENQGYFHAPSDDPRPSYCLTIPPPNVTGSLHMGHALQHAIHDVVVRWKRMCGMNVLCLPGTDHAGIATQFKVEQELRNEGQSRHDLGREKMVERVWEWKEKYGGIILKQLRVLGCSYDWDRERFTMDNDYARAVLETFVQLYHDGLIYRGHRVINWCPRCLTALSDLEVEHHEEKGHLWHIRYPAVNGNWSLVVATTRPETLPGDTAVAVHPEDERYKDIIGQTVNLPLIDRHIHVIADEAVDPKFGSGALKITPAHDANDFDIGSRHKLPHVVALNEAAQMTEASGKYAGMDRYECRDAIINDLDQLGLLEKIEDYPVPLGHCYRCDSTIEPLMSEQWFVSMESLAVPAIDAIRSGSVKYVPDRFARMSIEWLSEIRDWCISRQIWWGHRIPVWHCKDCKHQNVALTPPNKCEECDGTDLEQDPDVLDTWFSSAIWPHATLGWPRQSSDMTSFYPTNLMITDRQILYLWVARMIIMGMRFTDSLPFQTIFVHPTVNTRQGRRMSKSLGTGIDPLDLIAKYGTDALRFGLIAQCELGQDIRFHEERLEMARNFTNKLWNASRFVLINSEGNSKNRKVGPPTTLPDRWILSRLHKTIESVRTHLEAYQFDRAAKAIYEFLWDDFCDWYVEIAKPILSNKSDAPATKECTQATLCNVLEICLRLLHPFMPFVTEELWQKFADEPNSIMIASYPQTDQTLFDDVAEDEMKTLTQLIRAVRSIKADAGVPTATVPVTLVPINGEQQTLINNNLWLITPLARLESVLFSGAGQERPKQSVSASVQGLEIYVPLAGMIDMETERTRLRKRLNDLDQERARCQTRLDNPNFIARAPANVVESERERLTTFEDERTKLVDRLNLFTN